MSTTMKIALVIAIGIAAYLFWKKRKEQSSASANNEGLPDASNVDNSTGESLPPPALINGGLSDADLQLQIDEDSAKNWKADKALKNGLYVPADANTRGLAIIDILGWMYTIKYESPKYWASIQVEASKQKKTVMTQLANAASFERFKQLEKEAGMIHEHLKKTSSQLNAMSYDELVAYVKIFEPDYKAPSNTVIMGQKLGEMQVRSTAMKYKK